MKRLNELFHFSRRRLNLFLIYSSVFADYNDGIVGECPADGVWTPWHNRDMPGGKGDWEVRSLYQPNTKCTHSKLPPLAIQARSVSKVEYQKTTYPYSFAYCNHFDYISYSLFTFFYLIFFVTLLI